MLDSKWWFGTHVSLLLQSSHSDYAPPGRLISGSQCIHGLLRTAALLTNARRPLLVSRRFSLANHHRLLYPFVCRVSFCCDELGVMREAHTESVTIQMRDLRNRHVILFLYSIITVTVKLPK